MTRDSVTETTASFCYSPTGSHFVRIYRRHRRTVNQRARWEWHRRWIAGILSMSCFATLLTGSLWMLLSFYSSENVETGKNYSRVYKANSLFVRSISVTNLLQNEGPVVYSFPKAPELSKGMDWSEAHNAIVPSNKHMEWAFWLNRGSQLTIQYNVSNSDSDMLLVVLKGRDNMEKWQEDSMNSEFVDMWNVVQGTGTLEYLVEMDQNYYIGLCNFQSSDVQVILQVNLNSKVHRTENYKSRCYPTSKKCTIQLSLLGSDVLLLTTPLTTEGLHMATDPASGLQQQQPDDMWTMDVVFEQRWITYFVFCGAIAIVMLVLLLCCRPSSTYTEVSQEVQEPIIMTRQNTNSSDEEEKQSEYDQSKASSTNVLPDLDDDAIEVVEDHICIICFEARRNCFFDPCGHCATCYSCSMKLLKQKSLCPLCRQPIRLVRRLFLT